MFKFKSESLTGAASLSGTATGSATVRDRHSRCRGSASAACHSGIMILCHWQCHSGWQANFNLKLFLCERRAIHMGNIVRTSRPDYTGSSSLSLRLRVVWPEWKLVNYYFTSPCDSYLIIMLGMAGIGGTQSQQDTPPSHPRNSAPASLSWRS